MDNEKDDNSTLTPYYTDTLIPIRVGDHVRLAEVWTGTVELICLPDPENVKEGDPLQSARGGIMFITNEIGRVFEPFGFYCRVEKIEDKKPEDLSKINTKNNIRVV
jgi:hypothetical protein